MKTNALKGMKDILPEEQKIRDYVQSKILETYRQNGFERISTPMLEDAENLDKSEGGDNLNLIFKVLKRGEKLDSVLGNVSVDQKALSDMGLRYDLTLPLTRFYAANRDKLQFPFKVIQTDRVFRAERPQKGRNREFVQCDIDILGDSSCNAEVELIDVTARALLNIGFMKTFADYLTITINDRRILKNMLETMGFEPQTIDSVCVTFDKLDKIGSHGIEAELKEKNFPAQAIKKLIDFCNDTIFSLRDNNRYDYHFELERVLDFCSDRSIGDDLKYIIDTVKNISQERYRIDYSPTLVRGQGYYTGVVFEIKCTSPFFEGAVGGGGRYDNLIGKFIGQNIPAVGFSIGFERICSLLLDLHFQIPEQKQKHKCVLLYDDSVSFEQVVIDAETLRNEEDIASVTILKKAKKPGPQYAMLEDKKYTKFATYKDGKLFIKTVE